MRTVRKWGYPEAANFFLQKNWKYVPQTFFLQIVVMNHFLQIVAPDNLLEIRLFNYFICKLLL